MKLTGYKTKSSGILIRLQQSLESASDVDELSGVLDNLGGFFKGIDKDEYKEFILKGQHIDFFEAVFRNKHFKILLLKILSDDKAEWEKIRGKKKRRK